MLSTRRLGSALLAAALSFTTFFALPASACGGLFCSRTRVDQAGEKILFATDGLNVTAYVQIQYQGEAQKFSWVVPVPSEPEVSLGSDSLFTALRNTTRPQFNITVTNEGNCAMPMAAPAAAPGAIANNAGGLVAKSDSAVQVLQQEQLGAFDIAVVKSDDPGALKQWLKDNDYVLPDKLDPLLDPYVAGKYDFVAVKLQKNASAGDIQPIVMKYKSTKPGIPIRLTGIAATPDMDVYVWVLGQKRAIPDNYRHAIINEARIDWLNYSPTPLNDNRYRETVTAAMNEAGGQAFVTDYAGDSSKVDTSGFDTSRFKDVDQLAQQTDPVAFERAVVNAGYFNPAATNNLGGPGGFVGAVAMPANIIANNGTAGAVTQDDTAYIPVNAQAVAFFKRFIPMPDSVKAQNVSDFQFYSQLGTYRKELQAAQVNFDAAAAVKALKDQVVQPYQDIKDLFKNNAYLTALYTTMSPEEMTQDPTFVFNGDLPKVDNVHTATGVRKCTADTDFFNAPVEITLKNGLKYTVARNVNGAIISQGSPTPGASPKPVVMPAADRIEQLNATGLAKLIQDNRDVISQALGIIKGSTVTVGNQTFGFDNNGNVVAVPSKHTSAPAGGFGCAGCANNAAPPAKHAANEGFTYALVVMGFLGYRRWIGRRRR